MMRKWFEGQLAAGLPAFAGSAISGTLAVKQELINELLVQWLAANSSSIAGPPADLQHLKRYVTRAAVRAETGRVLVDFSLVV